MITAPVLLWGSARDLPVAAVCTALHALGAPMLLFDPARAHVATVEVDDDGGGRLGVDGLECDLDAVRAVYARPDALARDAAVQRAGPGGAGAAHADAVDEALLGWLELTPARVLNRPSAMASNGSKPYQAALIRAAGLDVPDTLVTTDRRALDAFVARHGRVVYKSCSGVRSIVSRLDPDDVARLARLSTCPTQFQQYVPGPDYRVHVVGDTAYGHEIAAEADDYRYASPDDVQQRPWQVPGELAARLVRLSHALGLQLSGIDLRRAEDGTWLCFEVNPSPGFTYFDDDDQPVARAIARCLAQA